MKVHCRRIMTLEALRGLAFLCVMLQHTGIDAFRVSGRGGVSIFLILSGFLMVVNYYGTDRIKVCSARDNLLFALRKIRKLWLLHVVTTLACVIFEFTGNSRGNFPTITLKITLNILLIQEWLPIANRSINVVSWYLCTMILSDFIFPWVKRKMECNYSVRKAFCSIFLLCAGQLVTGFAGAAIPVLYYESGSFWTHDLSCWLMYEFPVTRLLDVFIGYNLGYLFVSRAEKSSKITEQKSTVFEVTAVILIVVSNMIAARARIHAELANPAGSHPDIWWTYVVVFTVGSVLAIWHFALGRGRISRLLTNRITFYLAGISAYGFLIHYVVFKYINAVIYHLPGIDADEVRPYGGIILLVVGIPVSILATEIWMRYFQPIWDKRKE